MDKSIQKLMLSRRSLTLDEINLQFSRTSYDFKSDFEDAHSPFNEALASCSHDLSKCPPGVQEQYDELFKYIVLLTSDIVHASITKPKSASHTSIMALPESSIFIEQNDFIKDINPKNIEDRYNKHIPEYRLGFLPEMSVWVNQQVLDLNINSPYLINEDDFLGVPDPDTFTNIYVPEFLKAIRWHPSPRKLSRYVNKFNTGFEKIEDASQAARQALPITLDVYQAHAAKVTQTLESHINLYPVIKALREFKLPEIKKEERGVLIEGMGQAGLINLGVKLGLWKETHTENFGRESKYYYEGSAVPKLNKNERHEFRLMEAQRNPRIFFSKFYLRTIKGVYHLSFDNRAKKLDSYLDNARFLEKQKTTNYRESFNLYTSCLIVKKPDCQPIDGKLYFKPDSNKPWRVYMEHRKYKILQSEKIFWTTRKDARKPKSFPFEKGQKISLRALSLMKSVIQEYIDHRLDVIAREWREKIEKNTDSGLNSDLDNLARSRYAVDTFSKVGYGNCNGAIPEFNTLHTLDQSMPLVYASRGVTNPENFVALHNYIHHLSQSHNVEPSLLELPDKEEAKKYCNYGFGDTVKAKTLLDNVYQVTPDF